MRSNVKRSTVFLFTLCFFFFTSMYFHASPSTDDDSTALKLNSTITAVTVFPDRAQITRTASQWLPKGEHVLVFPKLPYDALEKDSVQVDGKGPAVLLDVSLEETRFKEIPNQNIKQLFSQKEELEEQDLAFNDQLDTAEKEKLFMDKISNRVTAATEKSQPGELDPEKWRKMTDYYRQKIDKLNAEIRLIKKKKRKLAKHKEQLDWKIKNLKENGKKMKYQAKVRIRMSKAGNLSLKLSYRVSGPGWTPVYDLRASSTQNKMELKYKALIRQNTGEDWTNVTLSLSTAAPADSFQHPAVVPWYIRYFRPRYKNKTEIGNSYNLDGVNLGDSVQRTVGIEFDTNVMSEMTTVANNADSPFRDPANPIIEEDTVVKGKTTTSLFEASGKRTVISDDTAHTITVMTRNLKVHYRYTTFPKKDTKVYLKSYVCNDTGYPLMAGDCNIFMENSFITRSKLQYAAPGEKFWVFLGPDNDIKVEYIQKQTTMKRKKEKQTFESIVTITYNKKICRELMVWDQMPLTRDDSIKVKLLTPQLPKDYINTKSLKYNKASNVLIWFFHPTPGEKIKVPFKYAITFPSGKRVEGF